MHKSYIILSLKTKHKQIQRTTDCILKLLFKKKMIKQPLFFTMKLNTLQMYNMLKIPFTTLMANSTHIKWINKQKQSIIDKLIIYFLNETIRTLFKKKLLLANTNNTLCSTIIKKQLIENLLFISFGQ